MNEEQFQNYAYNQAMKSNDKIKLKKDSNPQIIWNDVHQINLQNLYRIYLNNPNDTGFINKEIDRYLNIPTNPTGTINRNFNEIRPMVLPQFIPSNFLTANVELVNRDFVGGLKIAYVIDLDTKYRYILKMELDFWEITQSELDSIAFSNLDSRSGQISVRVLHDKVMMMETVDAFNAIRVMSPKFRNRINKKVGNKVHFGIPNRDFLVCWSTDSPVSIQSKFKNLINEDFKEQDHPLTNRIFSLEKGKIEVL